MPQCDPREHLVFNSKEVRLNDEMSYWYFQSAEGSQAEASQRNVGISFQVKGVPVGVSYDDAAEFASRYEIKTDTSLVRKQSSVIIEKNLSPGGVQAYMECLRQRSPLVVSLDQLSDDWNSVTFAVEWDVKVASITDADLEIEVEGGTFKDGTTSLTRKIPKGFRGVFRIRRNASESISFIASVEGQEIAKEVPPKPEIAPPQLVKREIDLAGIAYGAKNGPGYGSRDVSISADGGTALLPSTAQVVVTLKQSTHPDYSVDSILSAEVVSCSSLVGVFRTTNRHGNNPGDSIIQGRAIVYQVGSWT